MPSPLGPLTLLASAKGLAAVLFCPPPKSERIGWICAGDLLADTHAQLTEYFSGLRQRFALPLDPHGTAFQLRVWGALCDIPHGETTSYAELARKIGNPAAVRAVGLANARNPISIIVPCHRVVGSSGRLVGLHFSTSRQSCGTQEPAGRNHRDRIPPISP